MPAEQIEAQAQLVIHLFGPIQVWCAGAPIAGKMSQYARWLLALLVLRKGSEQPRTALAQALWPWYEPGEEAQRAANFRQQLLSLKRALGDEAHRIHESTDQGAPALSLDQNGVFIDVFAFESAYWEATRLENPHGLEEAVRLYRGELLAGCSARWAETPRRRLRGHYLDALERLAEDASYSADLGQSEVWLRQAIACDPLRESAVRKLLLVLQAAGKTTEAEPLYRDLVAVLRRDRPDHMPEASTRELYQRINQGSVYDPKPPPVANVPRIVNLPAPINSLVGREKDCEEIAARFLTARLVTLIGPGGIGKTRLALEVARRTQESYRSGAVFADFSALLPAASTAQFVQVLAESVHLSEVVDKGNDDALLAALSERELLLVLDNCEHVLPVCASLIKSLLQKAPNLHILATSREALQVSGERPYRVPCLTLPPASDASTASVLQSEAGRLFLERVFLLDFLVTEREAPLLAWICHTLDGIPLAIELAAAALDTLPSVEALAEQIRTSFWFLQGGDRTAPDRYQRLEAAIAWSYELLTPEEQTFLRGFSVLTGGGTIDASEAVCAVSDGMHFISRLVSKSLIAPMRSGFRGASGRTSRFRLSDPVRQYGREKLEAAGEAHKASYRHAAYFTGMAEAAEPEIAGPRQAEWLDRLESERVNLQAALSWCSRASDGEAAEMGLRLAGALWRFWIARGGLVAGEELMTKVLERGKDAPVSQRLKAMNGAGNLAYFRGDYTLAHTCFHECLRLAQQQQNRASEAAAYGGLASVAIGQGDFPRARALFETSLQIFGELQDRHRVALVLGNLANVATYQRDFARATARHWESVGLLRELGKDPYNLVLSLNNLSHTLLEAGDLDAVPTLLEEIFTICRDTNNRRGLIHGIANAITLAVLREEAHSAALMMGIHDTLRTKSQIPLSLGAETEYQRMREKINEFLGEARFAEALEQGMCLEDGGVIPYALRLVQGDQTLEPLTKPFGEQA